LIVNRGSDGREIERAAHLAHKAQCCLCVCTVPLYIFSIFIFFLQFKALEFWRRGEVRFVRQVRLSPVSSGDARVWALGWDVVGVGGDGGCRATATGGACVE
jgi:hypothetical protein